MKESPRSYFFCPLTTFNNPLAGRLDPGAFWPSFQLFRSRPSPNRALRPGLGRRYKASYPNVSPPGSPPCAQPRSHGGGDLDTDSSESVLELETHIPAGRARVTPARTTTHNPLHAFPLIHTCFASVRAFPRCYIFVGC